MTSSTLDLLRIGIVGGGRQSADVAELVAASGRTVILVSGDRTSSETIQVTSSTADLHDVDAVIVVTDDGQSTKDVLIEAADVVTDHVPLLIGSGPRSITELAAGVPNPRRVAGFHVVDTLPAATTVEVVRGLRTGEDLIGRLIDLADSLPERHCIVVDDRPGYLIDALLVPYLNDVIAEFDDGLASASDIDVALELGLGYRTGPLKLLDRIGLDTHLTTTSALYAATADTRYAPPPLLTRMVAAGRVGGRTDTGFHATNLRAEGNN